jgi:class 3 adenylate cyclase
MARPRTRYAETRDGLVAYQVIGDGPRTLLYLRAFGNVETQWDVPPLARFLEQLAALARVIVFDRRGSGASDPVPLDAPPTWEEWADDALTVMDDAGVDRAAVLGEVDAGPIAILLAASHPERVTSLVLATTTAKYMASEDFPIGVPEAVVEDLVALILKQWGNEELAAIAMPSLAGDVDAIAAVTRFVRTASTPRTAAAQYDYMFRSNDTRAALPLIAAPTLVLHHADNPLVPVRLGRHTADCIADAEFHELAGADSYCFGAAADEIISAIAGFLTGNPDAAEHDRLLATMLFTDIVESTQRATQLGDADWARLLARHYELVRAALRRYDGREVDTAGDGFFAMFDAPGKAVRCARAIREDAQNLGIAVRCGIHTGEVQRHGSGVAGIAVHIAARVAAAAQPGQTLVSRTVTDLVAGSSLRFADRGIVALKGLEGSWQLFEHTG